MTIHEEGRYLESMTLQDFMLLIILAVDKQRYQGDKKAIQDVAMMLLEHDQAKNVLRNRGYGVTGTSLVETVKEVPSKR